ncbi:MAG TPA: DsrE family protein [Streptosporangiaceae bacterium]|nr:DsrE family protein [Streptosporangiaceae bacterium]
MKFLFVLHDPPYGTERTYNGLRWARQMLNGNGNGNGNGTNEVRVFLIGDAVASVRSDQKTPNGYYNIEKMLQGLLELDALVGICGSCLDARGIREEDLVKGSHRSSMKELASWTEWADKAINV